MADPILLYRDGQIPTTGGPGGVGVGSTVRRKADGFEAVVVGFWPPSCTTVVRGDDHEPRAIDTCDYLPPGRQRWEVVHRVEPSTVQPLLDDQEPTDA